MGLGPDERAAGESHTPFAHNGTASVSFGRYLNGQRQTEERSPSMKPPSVDGANSMRSATWRPGPSTLNEATIC